jgi:hypothetical protein
MAQLKDGWRSFWERKGGKHKAFRALTLWLIILTILFLWSMPKRRNYTRLWKEHNWLMQIHDGQTHVHPKVE